MLTPLSIKYSKLGLSFTDLPSELDVIAVVCGVIFGLLLLCGVTTLVVIVFLLLFKKRKSMCNDDKMSEPFATELNDTSTAESSSKNKQIESGAPPSAASPLDPSPSSTPLRPSTTHTPFSAPSSDRPSSPPPRFIVLDVTNDCELKEFVEKKNLSFKRGCCFYQFTHDVEKIRDNQEVVLMNKVTLLNVSTVTLKAYFGVQVSWIGDPANIVQYNSHRCMLSCYYMHINVIRTYFIGLIFMVCR